MTKTILITGAAGGIGRATVQIFAQKGWRVIGVDIAPYGEKFPSKGFFIQANISEGAALAEIMEKTQAYTDTLDALVNNAALQIAKPILQTSVEEWDAVMAANLRSVFSRRKTGTSAFKGTRRRSGGQCILRPCYPDLG